MDWYWLIISFAVGIFVKHVVGKGKINRKLSELNATLRDVKRKVDRSIDILTKTRDFVHELECMVYDAQSIINEQNLRKRAEKLEKFYEKYKDIGEKFDSLYDEVRGLL